MWRIGPRTAAVRALCLLIISLAALNSVSAQDAPADTVAGGTCSFEGNKAFERRPSPALEITTKFIAKPDTSADVKQMRMHFIFSRILGRYASRQIYSASLRRCSFTAELDASFDLHFELNSIGSNVHDECSLSRCAGWLSDLLGSAVIDQTAFSNTTDEIVKTFRRFDTAHLRNLRLGVSRAVQEAYRQITGRGHKSGRWLIFPQKILWMWDSTSLSRGSGANSARCEMPAIVQMCCASPHRVRLFPTGRPRTFIAQPIAASALRN